MRKNHIKFGFSLIELSIVILVIGILVLGVTKGAAIIAKAKIGSARSLTNGSPVAVIPNLAVWYETTLDSSFSAAEAIDTTVVGTWYDNAPTKSSNATEATNKPTYYESGINNLPALRFDGTNDILSFNGNALQSSDYTIFVVEQRRAASTSGRHFLTFGNSSTNNMGYSNDTTIANTIGSTATVAAYGPLLPRITTLIANNALNGASNARNVFVNGTIGTTSTDGTKITFTTSATSGKIGAGSSTFYSGDIAEIIIYSRALKVDERNDVQNYLSKKYSIVVTASAV